MAIHRRLTAMPCLFRILKKYKFIQIPGNRARFLNVESLYADLHVRMYVRTYIERPRPSQQRRALFKRPSKRLVHKTGPRFTFGARTRAL